MKKKVDDYRLVTHGITLLSHEMDTVRFLLDMYHVTIELLRPSYTPGVKMPDFLMFGIAWETKSPQGKELRAVEHAFKNAAKQSENIVIDLRRTKIPTQRSVDCLEKRFRLSRHVKCVKIITEEENVLDFRKKSC